MQKLIIVAAVLAWGTTLAGCISTQEMPLSPNMVRIDTQARGALFVGQAVPATMRAAAQATLARGYTHFKLADPELGQGSELSGGSYYGGSYGGNFSFRRARLASSAATVIMFHADEPGAKDAFSAEEVLRQYH
jgi:hypothetical protein